MSIVTEVERIKLNIANAYQACLDKGAVMPNVRDSNNLSTCISSITGERLAVYTEGSSSVNLHHAKQDDILDYTIHGGAQHSRLPQEYQVVDYIMSSGTQYIDTRYRGSQATRFIVKQAFMSEGSTAAYWAIGSSSSDGKKRIEIGGNPEGQFWSNHGAITSCIHPMPCDSAVHTFEWSGTGLFAIDGIVGFEEGSLTASFTCDSNFYLFKDNGRMTNCCPIKFYYCQVYDGDVLVRDFIPCYRKSDNVAGLYDTVNQVFYMNSGTGTFEISINTRGVGDLVTDENNEHYGEYKIPVTIIDEDPGDVTVNIYISEPLRQYEGVADYINYKNKKLIRKIRCTEVDGTSVCAILSTPIEESLDLPVILLSEGSSTMRVDTDMSSSVLSAMYLADLDN